MARSDFVRSHFDEVEKAGLPLGLMSALGQKRTLVTAPLYVRSIPESGHSATRLVRYMPLRTSASDFGA